METKELTFILLIICSSFILLSTSLPIVVDQDKYCKFMGMKIKEGGTRAIPGKCFQVTCEEVRDSIPIPIMSIKGCPKLTLSTGCRLSDYSYKKQFPECCPQQICY